MKNASFKLKFAEAQINQHEDMKNAQIRGFFLNQA